MDSNLNSKVDRLNELYSKSLGENKLTNSELQEQSIYREELLNYFKFAINKNSKGSSSK